MSQKLTGTIKYYNSEKGYGFIKAEDGQEYFFHISGLVDWPADHEPQRDEDRVEFEVEQAQKGPRAVNVVLVVADEDDQDADEDDQDADEDDQDADADDQDADADDQDADAEDEDELEFPAAA